MLCGTTVFKAVIALAPLQPLFTKQRVFEMMWLHFFILAVLCAPVRAGQLCYFGGHLGLLCGCECLGPKGGSPYTCVALARLSLGPGNRSLRVMFPHSGRCPLQITFKPVWIFGSGGCGPVV